ncbi:MAG: hypothetical protein JWN51_3484 [Phycisphaerales bacterium]|nr:hypothetical protein [Phycisphaerales bacterium]
MPPRLRGAFRAGERKTPRKAGRLNEEESAVDHFSDGRCRSRVPMAKSTNASIAAT